MRFALAALATWRMTHLLAREDGPGGVVARAREAIGSRPLGELMDCFGCLSIWVAAGFTPYVVRPGRRRGADSVVAWLALSGTACLLERLGDGSAPGRDRRAGRRARWDAAVADARPLHS